MAKKRKEIVEPVVIPVGDCGDFEVTYRRFAGDEGPAAEFYGFVGPKRDRVKLLRFDDFENDPHYHYHPDTPRDKKYSIDRVVLKQELFDFFDILELLPEMVTAAGQPTLAAKIRRCDSFTTAVLVTEAMGRLRRQQKRKTKK